MDARLFKTRGHRPAHLLRSDLPEVARAIVACERGQARVYRDFRANIAIIILKGVGIDVLVRGDDWALILPYLNDTTSQFSFLPTPWSTSNTGRTTVALDEDQTQQDPELYQRVLTVLNTLFTRDYPTSNL